MEFIKRLRSFLKLKKALENLSSDELKAIISEASSKNPWFTEDNILLALKGINELLNEKDLKKWLSNYNLNSGSGKKIGVIMAGNIPMVGFHDLLCTLLSNHHLKAKLSSQDDVLLPFIVDKLVSIEPEWEGKIEFIDKVKNVDAVIATGSDNSSRYFEYYFRHIPTLIRKNRTSVAIIKGNETKQQLKDLGKDIYQYFGMGCRNVSKILVPKNFDITGLLDELNDWFFLIESHKFMNNHTYNRAIYAMEQIKYFDNGFSLFTQNKQLVSPTSVIYYDYYETIEGIYSYISENQEKIQCIVSDVQYDGWQTVKFGQTQMPKVWDYSDNVDTMKFLLSL